MAEILGLGISHFPLLSGRDENMAAILKGRMEDPDVPAEAKDPANWPQLMQEEWGDDEGTAGGARHREDMLRGIRKARAALDEFKPDIVVIWGDDQYENFKETIIPPFCVHAYEDMTLKPWAHATESAMFDDEDEWGGGHSNVWGEPNDTEITVRGHREAAKELATNLLENEFDTAYAYEPLHHPGLPHAFLNTVLYLDYDRTGFPYPVIPFQLNCYGRAVISYKGFVSRLADAGRPLDPPSPSPARVFDLGAQVAKFFKESPWRVALIASSSWSHAFLNDSTYRMLPDVEYDREMYQALVDSDWATWRNQPLSRLEEAGDQEMLNWMALAGAMDELGRKCTWSECVETYLFNSTKVAAVFEP